MKAPCSFLAASPGGTTRPPGVTARRGARPAR
jgi:hypothetical protein